MNTIGDQLASEHADSDRLWRFGSMSLRDRTYGELKPAMLVLLAASSVLLLIGCLNVANLLLSRATARKREIAVRQALGASQGRIMRQLLTESILLAMAGGAVGLGAAIALVRLAGAKLPGAFHIQGALAVDWPVAGFALAVSFAAGLIFGLAPALESGRRDWNRSLKTGETRVAGAIGSRLRSVFISVQVGLSLMLLVSACLLVRSLWKLTKSPLGFEPDHVLTFDVNMQVWKGNFAPTQQAFNEIQRRLQILPGIAAVGEFSALPTVDWHARSSFDVDWKPRTAHQDAVSVENRHMGGNYLLAMRIPLLAGRELREDDQENDKSSVLVNEEFVREYLPNANPLGRHLINDGIFEIVGVIGDVRGTSGSIAAPVEPEVYWPINMLSNRSFVIRSQLPPEQLTREIRELVRRVDPQQAIGGVHMLEDMVSAAVAQPRINMALLVSFAGIALLLACVGIYGVVAYSVAQRRQEIGVRMALGATRSQISLLFLRRTMLSTLIGLTCGAVATLLVTRLLRSQLYGVEPDDPGTFFLAILLLLVPVLVASLRPALQAASINPMEALRTE
jgi:predicted permease